MIYKNFQDMKLSALGFGCMRYPIFDGDYKKIDEEQAKEMIDYAMANGVNYYDTAYGYHDGVSEVVTGKLLSAYPRSSYYLADKFPGYDLNNMDKVQSIFETQLERCGVDYFDFYLFHNVCELNIDGYLDEKYGIYDYLMKQKQNGRIRHLGFSAHGNLETMKRFLEAYGKDMEFCQLQINWLDWTFQQAKEKVALLKEYNIPVWVMEPLRGGKLTTLSDEYMAALGKHRENETGVSWAFRFIQSLDSVVVTLSGMSSLRQVEENIAIFDENKPLSAEEMQTLQEICDKMINASVPCTSCRYCTSHCPNGLDIPHLISLYNEHVFTGGGFIAPMALSALDESKKPSACIGCRSCEAVCPQQIKIAQIMADFTEKLK